MIIIIVKKPVFSIYINKSAIKNNVKKPMPNINNHINKATMKSDTKTTMSNIFKTSLQ